jgi:hypothetical protein
MVPQTFQPDNKTIQFLPFQHIHRLLQQGNYEIFPIHNGLSDHDAQMTWIHNVHFHLQNDNIQNRPTSKINIQ